MSRKPKTPLLAFLQRACHAAIICETTGISFEELEERRFNQLAKPQVSRPLLFNRRDFLKTASVATLGGLLLSTPTWAKAAQTALNVVIVGGGIAGLNAAYQLAKRGVRATIYEAGTGDSWGRIQTRRDDANNLTTELGGEFIDTGHAEIRQLVREFNLHEDDMMADAKRGKLIKDSYYFGGKHYTEAEVVARFKQIAGKIKADADSLPEDIGYNSKSLTPRARKLDNTPLEKYLTDNLRLRSDWLYDLLATAYTSEFGLDVGQQSALNFLTMISTDVARGFEIFGDSDERFKIRGGNDKLIGALIKKLDGQIETGRKLEAIRQGNSRYTLHFSEGPAVTTNLLVLAIPFSTLRHVELNRVILTVKKREAIKTLGYGTNSKLLLDVSSRVWRQQRRAGYLFSERVQNGWDNSQGQRGNRGAGSYTVYLGGEAGRTLNEGRAAPYVDNLEKAFKGFRNAVTRTEVVNWSENPLSQGSYACYMVGQWTGLSGVEFEPDGNLHFCGEHCSGDYQGFMNGGVETGGRVAAALLRKLRVGVKR